MGDMNVQLVMEKLGGGGHMTMAGAQFSGLPVEEVREKLVAVIASGVWQPNSQS